MSRKTNKLTKLSITKVKCSDKQKKLSDGGGLYLLLHPNKSKYWRMKYRFAGREKTLSFGVFPEVSLADARIRRDEAKRLIREGKDPSHEKKKNKHGLKEAHNNTLEVVTLEWLAMRKNELSPSYYEDVKNALKNHILPFLGDRPISSISSSEVLEVLKKLEFQNKNEAANRLRQRLSNIFSYACLAGRCEVNPLENLKGTLASPKKEKQKALDKKDLPEFLKKLDNYGGELITKCGIWIVLYTLARTSEIRKAVWDEFDLDCEKPVWVIPGSRMKMNRDHVIPLSGQALAVFEDLKQFSKGDPFIFHQLNNFRKPISENAMLFGLYRMGYKNKASIHGFRATASTIMNEEKIRPDVIEKLLAHESSNKVRAAYNRYEYLDERREALQWWADYLDDIIKRN